MAATRSSVASVKASLFSSSGVILEACNSLHVNTLQMKTLYSSKKFPAALKLSQVMLKQLRDIMKVNGEVVENVRILISIRMLRMGIFKAQSDLDAVAKEAGLILYALASIPDDQKNSNEFVYYEKCNELLTLSSSSAPTPAKF